MAHSPQQNGVAEKVRALMMEAFVPKFLWNEAMFTSVYSVYLINRNPTKALD